METGRFYIFTKNTYLIQKISDRGIFIVPVKENAYITSVGEFTVGDIFSLTCSCIEYTKADATIVISYKGSSIKMRFIAGRRVTVL